MFPVNSSRTGAAFSAGRHGSPALRLPTKEALPNRPLLERDLPRRSAAFVCLEQSQRLPPVRMPTPGCFQAQLAILALDGPCGLAATAATCRPFIFCSARRLAAVCLPGRSRVERVRKPERARARPLFEDSCWARRVCGVTVRTWGKDPHPVVLARCPRVGATSARAWFQQSSYFALFRRCVGGSPAATSGSRREEAAHGSAATRDAPSIPCRLPRVRWRERAAKAPPRRRRVWRLVALFFSVRAVAAALYAPARRQRKKAAPACIRYIRVGRCQCGTGETVSRSLCRDRQAFWL